MLPCDINNLHVASVRDCVRLFTDRFARSEEKEKDIKEEKERKRTAARLAESREIELNYKY